MEYKLSVHNKSNCRTTGLCQFWLLTHQTVKNLKCGLQDLRQGDREEKSNVVKDYFDAIQREGLNVWKIHVAEKEINVLHGTDVDVSHRKWETNSQILGGLMIK